MTTEQIKAHLIACGFAQRSKSVFRHGLIEAKVIDTHGRSRYPVVTVSLYDPKHDTDVIFVAESFVVSSRMEPPTCRRCNVQAVRGSALKNVLAGSSEWADGDMSGATLTLSGNADLIDCWKCPECGHSWT